MPTDILFKSLISEIHNVELQNFHSLNIMRMIAQKKMRWARLMRSANKVRELVAVRVLHTSMLSLSSQAIELTTFQLLPLATPLATLYFTFCIMNDVRSKIKGIVLTVIPSLPQSHLQKLKIQIIVLLLRPLKT
jgi:hypothetical protein